MAEYRRIDAGDPAPWFRQRATSNPDFNFDTTAGRYIVMCFHGTASDEAGRNMLSIVEEHRDLFDDAKTCFFGVSVDPADENRLAESMPGVRYFWDLDGSVSRAYGAIPVDASQGQVNIRRSWMVIDPTLRVRAVFNAKPDGSDRHEVAGYVRGLPPIEQFAGFTVHAPILILPDVFEKELCQRLIGLYEQHGGEESGFMREVDGKTVPVMDHRHKRRADYTIEDRELISLLQGKIKKRVVPEITKVHQFEVTRMERYIVSCYDSSIGGHFRAHRDNTTKGTAHRRFAVSINLNDEFEGGRVGFPEYGPADFKAPAGGAVVFSCSLLHQVSPVKSGKRYAFLPFLYDDAAAKVREQNNQFLDPKVGSYRAGAAVA